MDKVCYKDVALLTYSTKESGLTDFYRYLCATDSTKQNFIDLETNEKITLAEIRQNPDYFTSSVCFGISHSSVIELIRPYDFLTKRTNLAWWIAMSKHSKFANFANKYEKSGIVPVKKLLKWQKLLNRCSEKFIREEQKEKDRKNAEEEKVRANYGDFKIVINDFESEVATQKIEEQKIIEPTIDYEKEIDQVYEQAQKNIEEERTR